ncbi:MAG: M23 family metallopeptidase [Prevotellaceae bacterium]|jgi:murein DD-endopeptidase MepM/ murein hydrolase activator NlpD|nr:M23 family metallopeptidase [Prevotellaceae bacterium]
MNKIENSFYQKIRFKYKLSILNENTLEEVWRFRLSKLSVFLASFFMAVVYFFLIAFLIIQTPLRSFLPGYTENINLRKQVMLDAVQVDSLAGLMHEQEQYVAMLRGVMTGNVFVDSAATVNSLLTQENAKIDLEKSQKEAAFCDEFEEDEKYSVTTGDDNNQADMNYLMHRPARGIISNRFDEKNRLWGISMNMETNSSVYATLDGVVLFSGFSVNDDSFVMHIQHVNDLISVYKIKQPFLKKIGEEIRVGEILATLDGKTEPRLMFELWRKGQPLNPESYIMF